MITGTALILIFLFLSALHVYWAFGGQWGSSAVLPTRSDNQKIIKIPGFIPTLVVALGLLCLAAVVFLNAFELGTIHFPGLALIRKYGLWAIAGIFLLRTIGDFKYFGFFKKVKTTPFGRNDTRYYSPLCLLISVLTILLEMND